jgi:hypothetical protein
MGRSARRWLDGALVLAAALPAVLILSTAAEDFGDADRPPEPAQLGKDPLNLPALRELALKLDRRGYMDRAETILAFVSRRTWRDRPTQIWLLRRRLDQGRYGEAFASADALLRQDANGTARPPLFSLLVAAADDPQARPALSARLQADPWWRSDFLRSLGATATVDGARAVFSTLALGPNAPTADEYAPFINRLVGAGDYDGAHAAWLQIARPRAVAAPVLEDGEFAGRPDHTPFTWSAASGVGATSETGMATDGRTRVLRVDYDGYSAPGLPAQLLARPPGRYVLSWRERLEPAVLERMLWQVRCADTNKVLARAPPPVSGWREAAMTVETPSSGCNAQWIELAAQAGERRTPIVGWYAAFRLRPAA